jgi:hypothetical protein
LLQEPSLESVTAIVSACELDLVLRLARADASLSERVAEQLALSPSGRLGRQLTRGQLREADRALELLSGSVTPAIVIGPLGAALLGAPQSPPGSRVEFVTADPLTTERELRAACLDPIDAAERWRENDVRESWSIPAGGEVAIAREVPGCGGYRDLKRAAVTVELDSGARVAVAHPRDLLRMSDASPRDDERSRTPGLQALLEAVGS